MKDREHYYNVHRFHCSVERHFGEWKLSRAACLIYPWALRLSKHSHKLVVDPLSVALELGLSESSAKRAFKELRDHGFFVLRESGKAAFMASVHEVLSHKDWALRHPDQCTEKSDQTSTNDPLGPRLYAASETRVRFEAWQISRYRALAESGDFSDDQIVIIFEDWFFSYKSRHEGKQWWKKLGYDFWMYLDVYVRRKNRELSLSKKTGNSRAISTSLTQSIPPSVDVVTSIV